MIRQQIAIIICLMLFTGISSAQKMAVRQIKWKRITEVPPSNGQLRSPGFAGAINGVNNNVFIIAGGANFPNGLPWNGGIKHYSNEIHVLRQKGNQFVWNKELKAVLPQPIAYCGVTSTEKGIVYAGGENEKGISGNAFIVKWESGNRQIIIDSLPNLPLALTNVALTHIGNVVFAAGGDGINKSSNAFLSLDLNEEKAEWKILPDLPVALANATLIAQKNGIKKNIYLIGGRTKTASGISELHHSTFVFDVLQNVWRKGADISDGGKVSNLSAAAGVAVGNNYILIIGGDDGVVFHKIELYNSKIARAGSKEEKERLTREKNRLSVDHHGFYRGLLLYNTLRNKWAKIGAYPYPAQVTTTAVDWGNGIIVSSGEIKPGVRTPWIIIGKVVPEKE